MACLSRLELPLASVVVTRWSITSRDHEDAQCNCGCNFPFWIFAIQDNQEAGSTKRSVEKPSKPQIPAARLAFHCFQGGWPARHQ